MKQTDTNNRLYLYLDRTLNLIDIKYKKNNLSFSVPKKLDNIYKVIDYDTGYFEVETNYGEEYIDILGALENDNYDREYIKYLEKQLAGITIAEIEVRCR